MTATLKEREMPSTEPNRISSLQDRFDRLAGDLIDTQGKLRALERRFEDFVAGRFSPPQPDETSRAHPAFAVAGRGGEMSAEAEKPNWVAISCRRFCDAGYRGMDRCNACGCTGSMLMFRADQKTYPNTRDGWMKMRSEHPGQIKDDAE